MSEIIIGIDPGSRFTGYGIVRMNGNEPVYIGSGCIKTGDGDLASKLKIIYDGVTALIEQFKPDAMAVEETFLSKNVQSTVKLSEARASAIVAGANQGPVKDPGPAATAIASMDSSSSSVIFTISSNIGSKV